MQIDSMSIAAHFGLIDAEIIVQHRAFIGHSSNDVVTIFTDSALDDLALSAIEMFIDGRMVLHRVDPSPAFDEALHFAATQAGNAEAVVWTLSCDQRFRQRCPLNWFRLEQREPGKRWCHVCEKNVHLANDAEHARALAAEGKCTAWADAAGTPDYLLGDVDPDWDDFD